MRSLSREPTDRHPTIRAFADDLQQVAAAGPSAPSVPRAPAAAEAAGSGFLGSIKSLFGRKREE